MGHMLPARKLVTIVATLVIASALSLAAPHDADAKGYAVNDTADAVDAIPGDGKCETVDGLCTLRAAIQEANASQDRDTISVPEGVYTLTLTGSEEDAAATGDLDITSDLSIVGAGAGKTVVDGATLADPDRLVHIVGTNSVGIAGLTLRNGATTDAEDGGAILNSGTLDLSDVTVSDNQASRNGGGVFSSGHLKLVNTTIAGNTTLSGHGGGIFNQGSAVIENSLVAENASADMGGGIFNDAAPVLDLTSTHVRNNVAVSHGGGIYNDGGAVTLGSGNAVSENTAGIDGGGIVNNDGSMTLSNTALNDNVAQNGHGGGMLSSGQLALTTVTVARNTAQNGSGGGIYSFGSLVANGNTVIEENAAQSGGGFALEDVAAISTTVVRGNAATVSGGGIYITGSLTLTGSTIEHNSAILAGGGIYVDATASSATVSTSTIVDNTAITDGGGVYNLSESLTVIDSALRGNQSTNGPGGGLYNAGGVILAGSTIDRNSAGSSGGGLFTRGGAALGGTTVSENVSLAGLGGGIANEGALTGTHVSVVTNTASSGGGVSNVGELSLVNATISGNSASVNGGGVYTGVGADTELSSVTAAFNDAAAGANITNESGVVTVTNTILAGGSGGSNCLGAVTSAGNNSDDGRSCSLTGDGDLQDADARLGPLQDNGGATLTHALMAGSAAIDQGLATGCPLDDQRRVGRPQGAACDIGAFEKEQQQGTPSPSGTPSSTVVPALPTTTPSGTPSPTVAAPATPTRPAGASTTPTAVATPTPRIGVTPVARPSPTPVVVTELPATGDGTSQSGVAGNGFMVIASSLILLGLSATAGTRIWRWRGQR